MTNESRGRRNCFLAGEHRGFYGGGSTGTGVEG